MVAEVGIEQPGAILHPLIYFLLAGACDFAPRRNHGSCVSFPDNEKHRADGVTVRSMFLVAEVGLEPHDLRVMSPTSYQLLHSAV